MSKVQLLRPTLILLAGVAAVGKSTFIKEAAKNIADALIVDKDTIGDSFTAERPEEILRKRDSGKRLGVLLHDFSGRSFARESHFYEAHVRDHQYYCMLGLARDNLLIGKHPILDGNYSLLIPLGYIEKVVDLFFEGVEHARKLVWCHAPEEVIRERMQGRENPRDQPKLANTTNWLAFLRSQPIIPPEIEMYDHTKLDLSRPFEENFRALVDYLAA
jgi:predicted kinase